MRILPGLQLTLEIADLVHEHADEDARHLSQP